MELKRVVVTGLGALTPVGNNVAETWENLVKGVSGAGPVSYTHLISLYNKIELFLCLPILSFCQACVVSSLFSR